MKLDGKLLTSIKRVEILHNITNLRGKTKIGRSLNYVVSYEKLIVVRSPSILKFDHFT